MIRSLFYKFLFISILFVGLVFFLLTTRSGLELTMKIVSLFLPGQIEIENPKGRLMDHFFFDKLHYKEEKFSLTFTNFNVNWKGFALEKHPLLAEINWKSLNIATAKEKISFLKVAAANLIIKGTFSNLNGSLKTKASYFGQPLLISLQLQDQKLKGNFKLGANQIDLRGERSKQVELKGIISEPQLLHPELKGLQTSIETSVLINSATSAKATFNIKPGSYLINQEASLSQLQFKGGQLNLELNTQKLAAKGKLILDQEKHLALNATLPQFKLNAKFNENQPIQGNLTLKINKLNFLEHLSPNLSKIEGELEAKLNAAGTLKRPKLKGTLHLNNGRLKMAQIGLDLESIQFILQSQEQHWLAEGSIQSQGQKLQIRGKGSFLTKPVGILNIDANDFPLLRTEEYKVNIKPQLVLQIKPNAVALTGTILIPSAQFKPQAFNNSVSLSTDAVFVSNETSVPPSNPFIMDTAIQLTMGDKVELKVKGLEGFLMGTVQIRQSPQNPLSATGELTIRDGKYQAYGQDLTIDQGRLLFTGGAIENPGINLRASRQFTNPVSSLSGSNQLFNLDAANKNVFKFNENMKVGVLVTGRLKTPRIELFSEPSKLSQADILSMLLIGKPANQANDAGGELLLKAITSMNLGSNSRSMQLIKQFKDSLGLDVNIQTNSKLNQETNQLTKSNSVVVGKSLSKRLYVSYNFGLAKNDSNVLTLSYLLNKYFSIQVNSGTTNNSIDLLYTRHLQNKDKLQ